MALKIPKSEPVGVPKEACHVFRVLKNFEASSSVSSESTRALYSTSRNSLKTVHHGTIIAVIGGSDEEK
jgi:hypothetical protein